MVHKHRDGWNYLYAVLVCGWLGGDVVGHGRPASDSSTCTCRAPLNH